MSQLHVQRLYSVAIVIAFLAWCIFENVRSHPFGSAFPGEWLVTYGWPWAYGRWVEDGRSGAIVWAFSSATTVQPLWAWCNAGVVGGACWLWWRQRSRVWNQPLQFSVRGMLIGVTFAAATFAWIDYRYSRYHLSTAMFAAEVLRVWWAVAILWECGRALLKSRPMPQIDRG